MTQPKSAALPSAPVPPMGVYPFYDELSVTKEGITGRWYRRIRPIAGLIPIPRHTFFPLLYELYATWLRLATRGAARHVRGRSNLLVNVAAGSNGRPGWINVDLFKGPGITLRYDCRKRLPFASASVRGLFCEHFFEHLDYTEEVPRFLSECRRVLQPGGVLRLVVPDAGRYLLAYAQPGWQEVAALRSLQTGHLDPEFNFSYRTKMELINMVFRQGYHHKYAYDFETLAFVLKRYGFTQVAQQQFGHSLMPELAIDAAARSAESLYVDAVK